jgi:hypothetical protein
MTDVVFSDVAGAKSEIKLAALLAVRRGNLSGQLEFNLGEN